MKRTRAERPSRKSSWAGTWIGRPSLRWKPISSICPELGCGRGRGAVTPMAGMAAHVLGYLGEIDQNS